MTNHIDEQPTTSPYSNQQPVITIREGAVAASVWRRQSSAGMEYLEFSLSRSWKSKSGEKEGYSHNFFDANEKALVEVVIKASSFIRAQQTELTANDPQDGPVGSEQQQV